MLEFEPDLASVNGLVSLQAAIVLSRHDDVLPLECTERAAGRSGTPAIGHERRVDDAAPTLESAMKADLVR